MKKNFFIIADDLGLSKSVNDGIVHLFKRGAIDGASVMANGRYFNDARARLKEVPEAPIGIHLVLVEEKSIAPRRSVPSLVGDDGVFHKDYKSFFMRYMAGRINKSEVETEWRAQIKKCLDAGIEPHFLNGHQHLHLLPGLIDIIIDLAREFDIPYVRTVAEPFGAAQGRLARKAQLAVLRYLSSRARKKMKKNGLLCNDVFIGFTNAGRIAVSDIRFGKKVAEAREGIIEFGCHPGYEDEFTAERYRAWGYRWRQELNSLIEYKEVSIHE